MSSVDALVSSLRMRPRRACLRLVDRAEDQAALLELSARPEIRSLAKSPERVALLWAVCQIPDFRQLLLDSHLWLLSEIFGQLCGPRGVVDADWFSRQVGRLDDVQGDIETLMTRISFVRTWTYVANHESWVMDAVHWQQRTREIEDRLSDALHERLVQRFGAQGRTVTGGRSSLRGRRNVRATEPEEPKLQGPFSVLSGWKVGTGQVLAEAPTGVDAWVESIVEADQTAFQVNEQGRILFGGEWVGRLSKGAELLRPEVVLAVEDALGAGARLRLQRRLLAFARDWVAGLLSPLQGDWLADLSPAAKGLVYQLEQRLGTVRMDQARDQVAGLTPRDRDRLKNAGIAVGSQVVYSRALSAPSAIRRRVVLCLVYLSVPRLAYVPDGQGTWCEVDRTVDVSTYTAMGYPVMGDRGVRADVVERMAGVLGREAGRGEFALPERVCGWLGVESVVGAEGVMAAFGYRRVSQEGPVVWERAWDGSRKRGRTRKRPS
jgi:ATP-dependent RNA helicase SUPV3L1/SUV3